MKKLLRSLVVGSLVIGSAVAATAGYFSSNVTATGNLITTGTLRSAIDTTDNPTVSYGLAGNGHVVVYDNGGVVTPVAPFATLSNMQPGETRSVFFTIRNIGSLAFDYRAYFAGTWGDNALDTQNMLTATDVYRYPTGNCSGVVGCENVYYWLTNAGFSNYGVATDFSNIGPVQPEPTGTQWFGHASALSDGVNTLAASQFAVFRVDFKLSEAAGNDFQGKTFTYSLDSYTKQTTAPTF